MDNKQFQSVIGSLMYVTISTRPDIIASVTILTKRLITSTVLNWKEAKRVAYYLKSTIEYKLKLGNNKTDEDLIGYADADWEKRSNRKSNSGYLFKFRSNSISWACRKQTCIAFSRPKRIIYKFKRSMPRNTMAQKITAKFSGEYKRTNKNL